MTIRPILQVDRLTRLIAQQGRSSLPLAEINFEVFSGQVTALTGPAGAGSSAILRTVYHAYLPWTGRILYRCRSGRLLDLGNLDEQYLNQLRHQEIAYVGRFNPGPCTSSSLDLVVNSLIQTGHGDDRGAATQQASDLLQWLEVPESLWQTSQSELPNCIRQKVHLARAAIIRPRLLLLDDPTWALNDAELTPVVELLESLKRDHCGILMACRHSQMLEQLADHLVQLPLPSSPVHYPQHLQADFSRN